MRPSIAERRAALAASHPAWEPRTIASQLRHTAERFGDRPAVIGESRTLTYDDLWREARAVARGLIALGVRPGEHVAMIVANQPEFVVLQYGVACAGAVSVPFNFRLHEDEVRYVLDQSDAAVLVTLDRFGNRDYLALLDALAPGWRSHPDASFPSLRHVVVLPAGEGADPDRRSEALDLAGLVRLGEGVDEAEVDRRIAARVPGDVACVMYTSGTTGFSKGAMLSHDSMLRCGYAAAHIRAFEDGRRILFSLPLYHVFAYCEGMLAVTWVGGAIIPELVFDGERTFIDIERHRPQEALFVPTMALTLVEHPARSAHDLSSLYAVMTASAPAPVRLWEQVRRELGIEELVTAYGQTEATASTTYTMPDDPLELHSITVGRPKQGGAAGDGVPGHQVTRYKTIDPITGEDLPDGQEGELAVAGPQVMLGYYGKPEDTEAAFLPGGWLRSGDLGRIRPDGYLTLTGRSKELYKRGAELVAPREVENLLDRREDVLQSYVVGVPDERWGEVGWAFVVPAAGRRPTEDELLADCRAHLARFKVPVKVVFLRTEDLPLTGSGKVQKFKLAQQALAASAGGGEVPAP